MRQLFTIIVCIAFFSLFVQAEGSAKPTHEEMLAAMTKCNINVEQTLTSLRNKYQTSETEDQKDEIKADMRIIFYATDSKEIKQKVREFFRDFRKPAQVFQRTPVNTTTVGAK